MVPWFTDRDAWRLADYYAENKSVLKTREPVRDDSHCYPLRMAGASVDDRWSFISRGQLFLFLALLDPEEREIIGVANFSNVVRGSFPCLLLWLFHWREVAQGQGALMFEAR